MKYLCGRKGTKMILFNLPQAELKVRKQVDRTQVWDGLRRRWVALTPEEWVRQRLIHFLIGTMGYPAALIAVEQSITFHGLSRRCDLVVYNRAMQALMIIECKAPDVTVSQTTFDQLTAYNVGLPVTWLLATNGREWLCGQLSETMPQVLKLVDYVPCYDELLS